VIVSESWSMGSVVRVGRGTNIGDVRKAVASWYGREE
jgi:hypothetical protein